MLNCWGRNEVKRSNKSENISCKRIKIKQSDWQRKLWGQNSRTRLLNLRGFWTITQGPDFSLECNVCRKLECQWYFHIQAKTYIEWIKFLSKPNKSSFLGLFELTRRYLFSKIGLVTFLVLWPFNFMQKINSILKSCVANGRAVKRTDELIEYFH